MSSSVIPTYGLPLVPKGGSFSRGRVRIRGARSAGTQTRCARTACATSAAVSVCAAVLISCISDLHSAESDTMPPNGGTSTSVHTLPVVPDRSELRRALSGATGSILACGNGCGGSVRIALVFASDGSVVDASLTGGSFTDGTRVGDTAVEACVLDVVRRIRIPPFTQSQFSIDHYRYALWVDGSRLAPCGRAHTPKLSPPRPKTY